MTSSRSFSTTGSYPPKEEKKSSGGAQEAIYWDFDAQKEVMGIVFGVTGVEEPAWRVVARATSGYEVRRFPSCVSAAVPTHMSKNGNGGAFPILAGYIGVTSAAKNDGKQTIAMTAPVVQTPSVQNSFTSSSPIISTGYASGDMTLEFLLPSSFREIGDCPKPHDGRIELRMCSEKYVAVASFSGWCSENIVKQKLQDLILKCKNDRLVSDDQEVVWQLAQYNPPFTIPQFRRNEVWVTLEGDKTEESILHALSPNK